MIHILYLAAGSSRRFGSNKLLWELEGKPLYRHGLDLLLDFIEKRNDCTLTVVSRYKTIFEEIAPLGLRYIHSPDSPLGISRTIQTGIRSLTYDPKDYFLFFVADQPYVKISTLEALADAAQAGVLTASAAFGQQMGNPTLFSAVLAPELLSLTGDTGGRRIIQAHPENHRIIQVSCLKELEDLDTPPLAPLG